MLLSLQGMLDKIAHVMWEHYLEKDWLCKLSSSNKKKMRLTSASFCAQEVMSWYYWAIAHCTCTNWLGCHELNDQKIIVVQKYISKLIRLPVGLSAVFLNSKYIGNGGNLSRTICSQVFSFPEIWIHAKFEVQIRSWS